LERLGLQHAAGFSWEKSAVRTLEVYYDVAGQRRRRDKALIAQAS